MTEFYTIALPIIAAILLSELNAQRRDRSRERRDRVARDGDDNELAVLLREYRLHAHTELHGALTAEGIRFPSRDKEH